VAGIAGSLIDRRPALVRIERLKFGHLYRCSKCARYWFLQESGLWLQRIDDQHLALVERWKRPLTLDDAALATLAAIGGVRSGYDEWIAVPCAVRDVSGRRHEKSIALVTKQPPGARPERDRVHWADEVAGVSASPFALPLDVRRASAEKREVSMGFAPVGVVDGRGAEYTLTCASDFFDRNGVKGQEIRLSRRTAGWPERIAPEPAQSYFLVDWFDGCEKLLLGSTPPS
jgi:hypothetical protein